MVWAAATSLLTSSCHLGTLTPFIVSFICAWPSGQISWNFLSRRTRSVSPVDVRLCRDNSSGSGKTSYQQQGHPQINGLSPVCSDMRLQRWELFRVRLGTPVMITSEGPQSRSIGWLRGIPMTWSVDGAGAILQVLIPLMDCWTEVWLRTVSELRNVRQLGCISLIFIYDLNNGLLLLLNAVGRLFWLSIYSI